MSFEGTCSCGNITFVWHALALGSPRACQCEYCASKSAAYLSEPDTQLVVSIQDEKYHRTVQHGEKLAVFHECSVCDEVIFVSAKIKGKLYGVINATHLKNKNVMATAVQTNFEAQSADQKKSRWQKNWCEVLVITASTRLRDLKGFGPRSEEILAEVNIHSVTEFMAADPFVLYSDLKAKVKGTGLNSIYATIGAQENCHWQEVARTRKTEILMRLDDMGLAPKK